MLRRLLAPSLSLVCLTACGNAPSDPTVATAEQPIVNGTPSVAADDAVVMLVAGEGLCTGTLVAPNLVITARHCVAEIDESSECGTFGDDFDASSIGVVLGVHADFENQSAIVASGAKLFHEASDDGCTTDIAFILLDQNVPNAKIAAVRTTPAAVGEVTRTLGYGEDGQRGGNLTDGRYERKDLTVDSVGPGTYAYETQNDRTIDVDLVSGEILTGESTCFGDSGGPLLDAQNAVIAVTSRGIDGYCEDRPSIYSAVATHAALVQTAFEAAGVVVATVDAGAPDSGVASSSGGTPEDEGDDEQAEGASSSSSSGTALRDGSATKDDGGCSTGMPGGGLGGSGVLFALAGLLGLRRRAR